MDSLITAAARALAAGDPLGALKRVALRDDAARLRFEALRWRSSGISFERRPSSDVLRVAFGPKEAVARARCLVAEAGLDEAERAPPELDFLPASSDMSATVTSIRSLSPSHLAVAVL